MYARKLGMGLGSLVLGLSLAVGSISAASAAILQSTAMLNLQVYNEDAGSFAGKLTINVFDDATVDFAFANTSGSGASSIDNIAFEDGLGSIFKANVVGSGPTTSDLSVQVECVGTAACAGQNFKGSKNVPDNDFTSFFAEFLADPPPSKLGINPGQTWTVTFMFLNAVSKTADELAEMIADETGNFRIAMHILNCGQESCGAYANPIPGAVWLFGSALLGFFGIGYRRKRSVAAT